MQSSLALVAAPSAAPATPLVSKRLAPRRAVPNSHQQAQKRSPVSAGVKPMPRTTSPAASTDAKLTLWCRTLCDTLGGDHVLSPSPAGLQSIRTPDQGRIDIQVRGQDIEFVAAGWPLIDELGFKRSYRRELSIRISANREATAAAQDLKRRLLQPYSQALSEERRRASAYREQLRSIAACLNQAGFGPHERHVVGRSVQAQKPHGVLEDHGLRLPTTSTTCVTPHEDSAIAAIEVRGLSLGEVEAVHAFLNQLVAQRVPSLQLCA